ncbi:hypothetical protein Mapa_018859 [Marchantia paleacea]|nr:hypothetical protein Mapa_018859 [Marchantia paleacea]
MSSLKSRCKRKNIFTPFSCYITTFNSSHCCIYSFKLLKNLCMCIFLYQNIDFQ